MTGGVESAREAFARGEWSVAFAALSGDDALDQDDLERLAVAAHLVGERRACELAWERAHRTAATRSDADRAARCAFWLGFDLLLRGETARASGWLARAERFSAEAPTGGAAGLVLLPPFLQVLGGGDAAGAHELAVRMTALGHAAGDADLVAFGLLGQGEARLVLGDVAGGMRRLDEAMVSVTTGEVSPIPTGIIYCAVIAACMHARDLARAAEWTDALAGWCATDDGLVPYRGQCLVHRAQVLTARGEWADACVEAERARARLAEPEHPALGDALYQQAELHRLAGRLDDAEDAYRAASRHGREPIPGFGLLRLAQGRLDAASSSARRMFDETRSHPDRPAILAAVVEILVRTGAFDAAAAAADELDGCATSGGDVLSAMAATARASLLLARGEAAAAGATARGAIVTWHRLEMPYEEARARTIAAASCAELGDADAAELERDAAAAVFERLGATTALAHLRDRPDPVPLTARECDVIRLVAEGLTNREIAAQLVISEHTVARHLQNVFAKLGLSSRAAATAYAYEHGIVRRPLG